MKAFYKIAILCSVLSVLAACGGSKNNPEPTPDPTPTPMPRLEASAGSGSLKSTETVYSGGKSTSVSRTAGYVAPNPDQ